MDSFRLPVLSTVLGSWVDRNGLTSQVQVLVKEWVWWKLEPLEGANFEGGGTGRTGSRLSVIPTQWSLGYR